MVKKIEYLIIIALSVMIFFYSFIDVAIYDNNTQESTGVFSPIVPQNELVQELHFDTKTTVDAIAVQFATYASVKTNHNIVSIYKNGEKHFEKELPSDEVADNHFLSFPVHLSLSSGDTLTIKITSPDGTAGNAITAWIKPAKFQGNLYSYNSETDVYQKVDGELSLKLYTEKNIGDAFRTRGHISFKLSSAIFIAYCIAVYLLFLKTLNLDLQGDHS